MFVLSYRKAIAHSVLDGGGRVDQEFVDWLDPRPLTYRYPPSQARSKMRGLS